MVLVLAILFLLVYFIFPIKFQTKDYTAILCVDGLVLKNYRGEDKDVQIPNFIGIFPVISIGIRCFEDNETIETVVIPNNVKYIGAFAFQGCDNLKSVEASRIKVIDEYAFSDDIKLERVELGENVQNIGERAFAECHALTYIPSRSSLKEIGWGAFSECGIEELGDLSGVNVEKSYIFEDTPWMDKQDTDYVIINNVLQKYKGDKSVSVIPDGVEVLSGAYEAESEKPLMIYLPNSVKKITSFGLFCNPNYVIYIPASVEYIEYCERGKRNGCKIITVSGSYAERYAIDNDINYEIVDGWEVPEEDSAE
ncbi:MAG: hypothetical protein BWY61_00327 [Firmicutes bacterium ADurb.Bin354]|nr:MAG: hypothetical protein BWY61_00327 [Firmicutes bacterium ADurb.Bin354]